MKTLFQINSNRLKTIEGMLRTDDNIKKQWYWWIMKRYVILNEILRSRSPMIKFSTIPNRDSKPSDFWYAVKVEPQIVKMHENQLFSNSRHKIKVEESLGKW